MPLVTPKMLFEMRIATVEERKEQRHHDEALEKALQKMVSIAQPGGEANPSMEQYCNALAAMEESVSQDIDPNTGVHRPRGMTKSALQSQPRSNLSGLPTRRGGFSIDFAHRESRDGSVLHRWDAQLQRWVPVTE